MIKNYAYAVLTCLVPFLLAPEAQAQDPSFGSTYTVPGADVEWMAGALPSAPSTGQTGNLIVTIHVAETWDEGYSQICMHLTTAQAGASIKFGLYTLPFGENPSTLFWESDPIDASTTGRKCALLGDDGGTIYDPYGPMFFDATTDIMYLSLHDPIIGQIGKGRIKINSTGGPAALGERVIGNSRNIGFAPPTSGTNVSAYRGFLQSTVAFPSLFVGTPSTTIDTPYLPLVPSP